MTREKWAKMPAEAKRRKIAKLCKWKTKFLGYDRDAGYCEPDARYSQMPDYLRNLNAMHKAEKTLLTNKKLWDAYEDNLVLICCEDAKIPTFRCGEVYHFHATAAQRAEAFAITMEAE